VDAAIRAAHAGDLPGLLSLYRVLNPEDPPLDASTAARIWRQIEDQTGRTVLVAETADGLVGAVDVIVVPNLTRAGRAIMFVENVVVAVGHRRRGVGRQLLAVALDRARGEGCYKAQLLSAADPPAHAFYEANGFAASARGYRRYL
jgi:GNAT superfamily N-acetyltransferase